MNHAKSAKFTDVDRVPDINNSACAKITTNITDTLWLVQFIRIDLT